MNTTVIDKFQQIPIISNEIEEMKKCNEISMFQFFHFLCLLIDSQQEFLEININQNSPFLQHSCNFNDRALDILEKAIYPLQYIKDFGDLFNIVKFNSENLRKAAVQLSGLCQNKIRTI